MMIVKGKGDRRDEYDSYLLNHITNVQKSFQMVKDNLLKDNIINPMQVHRIDTLVGTHDSSKYHFVEYMPYLHYFYPTREDPKDENAFDMAWLHHQKVNKHHWQAWVLIRDEGAIAPLDMELPYIVEMLCDWHSFSKQNKTQTAFNWWNNNKNSMILSANTITTIERLIPYFKQPLTE